MALEDVDIGLEVILGPHLDGEKVMATPLGSLVRGILCEEGLGNLLKVMERARWQGVEPLRCRTLKLEVKVRYITGLLREYSTILY